MPVLFQLILAPVLVIAYVPVRSVVMAVSVGAEAVVVTVPILVIVDSLVDMSMNGVATNGNSNCVPAIGLSVEVGTINVFPVYSAELTILKFDMRPANNADPLESAPRFIGPLPIVPACVSVVALAVPPI